MAELTKEEKEQISQDIADSKKRIEEKERVTKEALDQAKEEAKLEVKKELEAQAKLELEAKEKEALSAKVKQLEEEKMKQEESYKQKLDAAISSQAVVSQANPFAGNSSHNSGSNPVANLSESQMDDIETASREAFLNQKKSR